MTSTNNIITYLTNYATTNGLNYITSLTENHTAEKLKNKTGINFVIVFPAYIRSGTEHNNITNHAILVFAVVPDNSDESKLFDCESKLNDLITHIKHDIENGVNSTIFNSMSDVEFSPEYNIFGGWMGWSMQFTSE